MRKSEEYFSKTIEDLMFDIPLKTSIKVALQMQFIYLRGGSNFIPASEEGPEYEEIMRINTGAYEEAKAIYKPLMKNVKEWKKGNRTIYDLFEGIDNVDSTVKITVLEAIAEWQHTKEQKRKRKNQSDEQKG